MLAEAEKPSIKVDQIFHKTLSVKNGLCFLFYAIFKSRDMYKPLFGGDGERYFPEIYKRKPQGSGSFFFELNRSGWEKRKQLLRECIEETDDF
jgi:hypothetical protein